MGQFFCKNANYKDSASFFSNMTIKRVFGFLVRERSDYKWSVAKWGTSLKGVHLN